MAAISYVHSFPAEEPIRRLAAGPGPGPAGPGAGGPSGPPAALNQESLKTDSSYGYGYYYPFGYSYYYPRYYAYGAYISIYIQNTIHLICIPYL